MLSEKLKHIDLSRPAHVCKRNRNAILKIGDIIFIKNMVFEIMNRNLKGPTYVIKFLDYTNFEGKTKRSEIPC